MNIRRTITAVLFPVLFALSGCHNEPQLQYKGRYDRFISILDSTEKQLLEQYKFSGASLHFSRRLQSGKVSKKTYLRILADENIEIFTPEQVFCFFGGSVYSKILYYRFISFSGKDELDLFNALLLPAMAGALNERFSGDKGALKDFTELFPKKAKLTDSEKLTFMLRHSPEGIKAAPGFFNMDRDKINRYIALRPDVKADIDTAATYIAGKWGLLWVGEHADAVLRDIPRNVREKLLQDYPLSATSIKRYRLLALVCFFRDVVDEKIDFFSQGSWYRLRHLL